MGDKVSFDDLRYKNKRCKSELNTRVALSHIFKDLIDETAVVGLIYIGVEEVYEAERGQGYSVDEAPSASDPDWIVPSCSHVIGHFHRLVESVQCYLHLPAPWFKKQSDTREATCHEGCCGVVADMLRHEADDPSDKGGVSSREQHAHYEALYCFEQLLNWSGY